MTAAIGTTPLCGYCGRPVRGSDLDYLTGIPYHIACTHPPGPMMCHGCICPPGSEATCQGLSCPRNGVRFG